MANANRNGYVQNHKGLVKIGKAAKMLGLSICSLRNYDAEGKLENCVFRTIGNTRLFDVGAIL